MATVRPWNVVASSRSLLLVLTANSIFHRDDGDVYRFQLCPIPDLVVAEVVDSRRIILQVAMRASVMPPNRSHLPVSFWRKKPVWTDLLNGCFPVVKRWR